MKKRIQANSTSWKRLAPVVLMATLLLLLGSVQTLTAGPANLHDGWIINQLRWMPDQDPNAMLPTSWDATDGSRIDKVINANNSDKEITLVGPNEDDITNFYPSAIVYSALFDAPVHLAFNWEYLHFEQPFGEFPPSATMDPAGYFLGDPLSLRRHDNAAGPATPMLPQPDGTLDENGNVLPQTGSVVVDIPANTIFNFYVWSEDNQMGGANMRVYDAQIVGDEADVPEPGALGLLGTGLLLVAGARRWSRRA